MISIVFIFSFPGVSRSLIYLVAKLHLIISRLHLIFSTSLSFVILFFTGVLHGGSTCWFIKDLIHSRSFHRETFLRSSSILHLAIRSAIVSPLSFEVVIYHSSFTGMRYLNPSLSSMELSWYKFHLKPSLRIVAIYGAHK